MSDSELAYEGYNESVAYEDTNLNSINPNNPQDMSQYHRLMIQGKCVKLPATESIDDELYQNFLSGFMSDIKDDECEKCKVFRFLWKNEDENVDSSAVPYGVPADIDELVTLINHGKIIRTQITPEPEKNTWKNVLKLTADSFRLTDKSVQVADSKVETLKATPAAQRKVVDNIINFISGNFYKSEAVAKSDNPGTVTMMYFAEYKNHLKVMKQAYLEGRLLPVDMIPSYNAGTYKTYKEVIAAVKRRYGRSRTQDTMMDLFRKLEKAFSMKTRHEFKIQNLRNILERQYLIDYDDFPACADYEGDYAKQTNSEEYNPIINTLLTYILFLKSVPKNRWDDVQKEYYQLIHGKPTYKLWHENRKELWHLLDTELKVGSQKDTIYEVAADLDIMKEINNLDLDEEGASEFLNVIRRNNIRKSQRNGFSNRNKGYQSGQNRNQNQNRFSNNRFQPNFNKTAANNNNNNNNKATQSRQYSYNEKRKKLLSLLCTHCSRHAGRNRYHPGPYGGGPGSKCPYDSRGILRQGYKFVSAVYKTSINAIEIPDFREMENEGLEYEENEEISQIQGQQLLKDAIGPFCSNE